MGNIAVHVLNGVITICWIVCVIMWIRRGCPVPRWVHIFAAALLVAGIATAAACGMAGLFSPSLMLSCVLVPPFVAYGGWLWMFGPEHDKHRETGN